MLILTDKIRHDWTCEEVRVLISEPLNELVFAAQQTHRRHFDPNQIQISTLLSIKTGGCPEDCSYCSQSAHHNANLKKEPLISLKEVENEDANFDVDESILLSCIFINLNI